MKKCVFEIRFCRKIRRRGVLREKESNERGGEGSKGVILEEEVKIKFLCTVAELKSKGDQFRKKGGVGL